MSKQLKFCLILVLLANVISLLADMSEPRLSVAPILTRVLVLAFVLVALWSSSSQDRPSSSKPRVPVFDGTNLNEFLGALFEVLPELGFSCKYKLYGSEPGYKPAHPIMVMWKTSRAMVRVWSYSARGGLMWDYSTAGEDTALTDWWNKTKWEEQPWSGFRTPLLDEAVAMFMKSKEEA